ncbi:MAG: VOC family protein [Alphaproteobacteria bacterium]|nr:VOC family protein [Alphaproteobacteria bacterium]MBU0858967.1 VOC family protein [Alphaproteobacteria bacterium]
MQQRISLITLGVRDINRAKAFYDALGWVAVDVDNPDAPVPYNVTGMTLALWSWDALAADAGVSATGSGFRGVAIAHNVRTREDVAVVLSAAEQAGGTIIKPAHDTFWGGHSGYFADPDGHVWEIAFNPFAPLGPNGEFQWIGS